jgi:hypothetical protein
MNKILIAVILAAIGVGAYFIGHAVRSESGGVLSTVLAETNQAAQVTAETNLASAAGDAASYYADHQTYVGMTTATLRSYDAGLSSTIVVAQASATAYCFDNTVSGAVAHLSGPGGTAAAGAC